MPGQRNTFKPEAVSVGIDPRFPARTWELPGDDLRILNMNTYKTLTEAERQVLIALIEMVEPVETPNNSHYRFYPSTLEAASTYFLHHRVDWQPGYAGAEARGWITRGGETGWQLTSAGRAAARQERRDHPPIWYWYRSYFTLTACSEVYSRFCAQLYGRDLGQTNFSDMQQIDFLLSAAGIRPDQRVLDLGCGRGALAVYLSEATGAEVWGVDYVPEAIGQARAAARIHKNEHRLHFHLGNFDHLNFPENSFDVMISVDTLYMPNDLPATLRKLAAMLAPGGRLLVFYSAMCFDPAQPRDCLEADGTELARALQAVGLPYHTWDFSAATVALLRRKRQLAEAMRAEFAREGTLFLWQHLMAESDGGTTPFDRATTNQTRYLYEIVKPDES